MIGRHAYFDKLLDKWQVYGPDVIAEPQPGFTVGDFEPFFLEDEQPTEVDRSIAIVANRFVMPGGVSSSQMKLVSVQEDHLVCRSWDGEVQGEDDVLVAKSWLLRRTPFDGKSRNGIDYTYHTNVTRTSIKSAYLR